MRLFLTLLLCYYIKKKTIHKNHKIKNKYNNATCIEMDLEDFFLKLEMHFLLQTCRNYLKYNFYPSVQVST